MKLKQKSVIVCLLFFLIGCATPGPQIEVKRTAGNFDYKTRIYENYDHNLQLYIPNYLTVATGDTLYRLPFVKEVESRGWEVLVWGEVLNGKKGFGLIAMPWSDSIESFLTIADSTSPDPYAIGFTTKEIRFGEINMIERSGQQQKSRMFIKERAFVYKQFAYRLIVINSFSPVTESDAEILGNLSFKSADKQSSPPERKLAPQRVDIPSKPQPSLPEKPQIIAPVTPEPRTNIIIVTGTSANIRSGAGNEFSTVGTVKQGDKLTLLGEHGEWFNVRLENGQEGWINSRFAKEQ